MGRKVSLNNSWGKFAHLQKDLDAAKVKNVLLSEEKAVLEAQLAEAQRQTDNAVNRAEEALAQLDASRAERNFDRIRHREAIKKLWADRFGAHLTYEERLEAIKTTEENLYLNNTFELSDQPQLDPMTGLFKGEDFVDVVFSVYGEEAKKLIVLFMDFNKFKLINDFYGHDVGDIVIGAMGDALNAIDGLAFHKSGDEFVLVLELERALKVLGDEEVIEPDIFSDKPAIITDDLLNEIDEFLDEKRISAETDIDQLLARVKVLLIQKLHEVKIEIARTDPILAERIYEEDIIIALEIVTGTCVINDASATECMRGLSESEHDMSLEKQKLAIAQNIAWIELFSGIKSLREIGEAPEYLGNVPSGRNLVNMVRSLNLSECAAPNDVLVRLREQTPEFLNDLRKYMYLTGEVDCERVVERALFPSTNLFLASDMILKPQLTGREAPSYSLVK